MHECDCVLAVLAVWPSLQTDLRVVQHSAAVLSSELEMSGHGEWMKCMLRSKRAHRVLVIDGDQAHFKQGLDALQFTPVRMTHSDSDCALVWDESIGDCSGQARKWIVPVTCCPAQRVRGSEEHEIHAVTYEVFLEELLPIRANLCEWNERSDE